MPTTVDPHLVTEDLVLGAADSLSLVIWRRKPTFERVAAQQEYFRTMMTRCPDGFACLIVIEEGTPNPDEPLRRVITQMMDDASTHLRGVAVAMEARGFASAALRAALTSMSMLTRSRFPRTFVASVDDAVGWLERHARDREGRSLVPVDARGGITRFRGGLPAARA